MLILPASSRSKSAETIASQPPNEGAAAIRTQRGAGKLTMIIFGGIFAAAIYSIYHIGPMFYAYLELQNQMQQAARVASEMTDEEIRKILERQMSELRIPAAKSDLVIERFAGSIEISLFYKETFRLSIGDKEFDIYTFEFEPYAYEDY